MSYIGAAALLFAVAVLSSCARQSMRVTAADGPCVIEGTVIYEDGRPANRAIVSARPTGQFMGAKVPSADTDELGHFQIKHLWLGEFAVTAKKEDEGYPDVSSGFYSEGKIERITLTSPLQPATVTLLLGPKAGWNVRASLREQRDHALSMTLRAQLLGSTDLRLVRSAGEQRQHDLHPIERLLNLPRPRRAARYLLRIQPNVKPFPPEVTEQPLGKLRPVFSSV
jgi:hypothetical protein